MIHLHLQSSDFIEYALCMCMYLRIAYAQARRSINGVDSATVCRLAVHAQDTPVFLLLNKTTSVNLMDSRGPTLEYTVRFVTQPKSTEPMCSTTAGPGFFCFVFGHVLMLHEAYITTKKEYIINLVKNFIRHIHGYLILYTMDETFLPIFLWQATSRHKTIAVRSRNIPPYGIITGHYGDTVALVMVEAQGTQAKVMDKWLLTGQHDILTMGHIKHMQWCYNMTSLDKPSTDLWRKASYVGNVRFLVILLYVFSFCFHVSFPSCIDYWWTHNHVQSRRKYRLMFIQLMIEPTKNFQGVKVYSDLAKTASELRGVLSARSLQFQSIAVLGSLIEWLRFQSKLIRGWFSGHGDGLPL
ncbi:hypothetical protein ACJX0J_018318, partial [Zea mays]